MKRLLKIGITGLVILLVLGPSFVSAEDFGTDKTVRGQGKSGYVADEIIVKFKAGVGRDKIAQVVKSHGTSLLSKSIRGKYMRLRMPKGKAVNQILAAYKKNPNVEYAEPNYKVHAFDVPNDPYYVYQWHFHNTSGGIQMGPAWNIQTGNNTVIVAVVDTGVAYEDYNEGRGKKYYLAPDLANTTFVAGYDFINNDAHPNDDNGHGTHVTGTIAQSTNNNLGVAGIAYNCAIMPVKVLNRNGSGTVAQVADGIYFATDNGAKVINMSLGSSASSITLEEAVAYAYNNGVTVVCAAGNDGTNQMSYPAGYDAYCIAVGATKYDESLAYYSNYGSSLDLVAPGGDTSVDQNNDGYADGVLQQTFDNRTSDFGYWFYQGTSMASPHVAGVAALLIANGTTGPGAVRETLQNSTKDLGASGRDDTYGWGLLDAYAALNYTATPVHDIATTDILVPASTVQGNVVSVNISVVNLGDFDEFFTIALTDTTQGVEIGATVMTLLVGGQDNVNFTWDTTGYTIGDHVLTATASPVADETNTTNNSKSTTVALLAPTHDIALTAIDAPASAVVGGIVSIDITVENQGTFDEANFTVTLTDVTDSIDLGTQTVASLAAGASTVVSFSWDTTSSSLGEHILSAEVAQISGETDVADNTISTMVTVSEQAPTPTMHIQSIDMSVKIAGPNVKATAVVTIVDESGLPVAGATVYGSWSDVYTADVAGDTDTEGKARVTSANVRGGGTFTFTVTNVVKDGNVYDPNANVETSDSITATSSRGSSGSK